MAYREETEKAIFEAGIKLGAVFHQFIGAPVSSKNVELLEKAIESCILLQPYVVSAEVKIDREKLSEKSSEFGYTALADELLNVEVKVRVAKSEVSAELKWNDELKYPLMKILEIKEV
ncbi:MAG TPA: dihydroneopterin aldolase [Archaeoglobaceae archaeon]|nr:dihydroneopterin aldolase [Archaeoglobaceae archaeon]